MIRMIKRRDYLAYATSNDASSKGSSRLMLGGLRCSSIYVSHHYPHLEYPDVLDLGSNSFVLLTVRKGLLSFDLDTESC